MVASYSRWSVFEPDQLRLYAHVIFGLLLCALDFSIRAIIKSGSMALARSTGTHPWILYCLELIST